MSDFDIKPFHPYFLYSKFSCCPPSDSAPVLSEQISSNSLCLFCQVYSPCCLPLVKHAHFAFLLLCLLSSTWFSCTVELHFLEKKWGLHTPACINCKSLLLCARQALPHLRHSAPPNTLSAQCLEHRPASCLESAYFVDFIPPPQNFIYLW